MRQSLGVVFLLAGLLTGCAPPAPATTVRVSGHVEATELRLATEVGGRILQMPIAEGDPVSAGDLVLRLDTRDVELALQRTRAEVAAARAHLRLLQAGARREDVRQAEAQLAAARAEQSAAEAELESAARDHERFEALLRTNAGSVKQRDDAATRLKVSRDRVAGAEGRVRAAQEAVGRLRSGARPEEIQGAEARVAGAEAQVATLQKALDDATLTSPAAGIVTEKLVEPGEVIAPRTPVAVLTNLADVWADVYVSEPDVPRIGIGQPAKLFTDAGGPGVDGRVTWISPRAEFTPRNVQTADERSKLVYRLRIKANNVDGLLKQGMPIEAEIPLAAPVP